MRQVYAISAAPQRGVCPGTDDRFLYATLHHDLGQLYHYFGRVSEASD